MENFTQKNQCVMFLKSFTSLKYMSLKQDWENRRKFTFWFCNVKSQSEILKQHKGGSSAGATGALFEMF